MLLFSLGVANAAKRQRLSFARELALRFCAHERHSVLALVIGEGANDLVRGIRPLPLFQRSLAATHHRNSRAALRRPILYSSLTYSGNVDQLNGAHAETE